MGGVSTHATETVVDVQPKGPKPALDPAQLAPPNTLLVLVMVLFHRLRREVQLLVRALRHNDAVRVPGDPPLVHEAGQFRDLTNLDRHDVLAALREVETPFRIQQHACRGHVPACIRTQLLALRVALGLRPDSDGSVARLLISPHHRVGVDMPSAQEPSLVLPPVDGVEVRGTAQGTAVCPLLLHVDKPLLQLRLDTEVFGDYEHPLLCKSAKGIQVAVPVGINNQRREVVRNCRLPLDRRAEALRLARRVQDSVRVVHDHLNGVRLALRIAGRLAVQVLDGDFAIVANPALQKL